MSSVFATLPALAAAGCALAGGGGIGWPAAFLIEGDRRARCFIAPAIGLALFGAIGALLFQVLPFTPLGIAAVAAVAWGASARLGRRAGPPLFTAADTVGPGWLAAAVALAVVPAFANAPHWHDGAVVLGKTVFDHGKVALVDAIAREGLPAQNPFFQEAGSANLLNYYYLWYLLAAACARVTGATGWEADVALTGVTALLALTTLAWAAMHVARHRSAAWWVLAIACTGSLKVAVAALFHVWLGDYLVDSHPLEALGDQASWVPQHLFATLLALLALLALAAILREARSAPAASVLVGALIGASYDSSVWIGGFALAAVLPCLSLAGLVRAAPHRRVVVVNLAITVATAAAFAAIFIARNIAILGHRKTIAFWSFPVLHGTRGDVTAANEIGFWLLLLPVDYGFAYILGLAWLACLAWPGWPAWRSWPGWRPAEDPREPNAGLVDVALALTLLLPLLLAQHFKSVIANNDLGWRVVLPSVFAMTIVSAAMAVRLASGRGRVGLGALMLVLLVPGLMSGGFLVGANTWQPVRPDSGRFADRAALWRAVRDVTPPDQAVLNNPGDLADLTPWPGNMGWALLSDRRSCAAGRQWLMSMAPQLSPAALQPLDARIARVFAGTGSTDDLRVLAEDHLCATLVLVSEDGAFAAGLGDNPYYVAVAGRDGAWRIYRSRADRRSDSERSANR